MKNSHSSGKLTPSSSRKNRGDSPFAPQHNTRENNALSSIKNTISTPNATIGNNVNEVHAVYHEPQNESAQYPALHRKQNMDHDNLHSFPATNNTPGTIQSKAMNNMGNRYAEEMLGQLGDYISLRLKNSEPNASVWQTQQQELLKWKSETMRLADELSNVVQQSKQAQKVHIEEITIMHSEIKKQIQEKEVAKRQMEEKIAGLDNQLNKTSKSAQEQAEQYQELQEAFKQLESSYETRAKHSRVQLEKKIKDAEDEATKSNIESSKLMEKLRELNKEMKVKSAEREKMMETEYEAWKAEIMRLERELQETRQEADSYKVDIKEAREQLGQERSLKEELNTAMAAELRSMQVLKEKLQQESVNQTNCVEQLQIDVDRWTNHASRVDHENSEMSMQIKALKNEMEDLTKRYTKLESVNQQLKSNPATDVLEKELQIERNGIQGCMKYISYWRNKVLQTESSIIGMQENLDKSVPISKSLLDLIKIVTEQFDHMPSTILQFKISMKNQQDKHEKETEAWKGKVSTLQQEASCLKMELTTCQDDNKTLAHELQKMSKVVEEHTHTTNMSIAKALSELKLDHDTQVHVLQRDFETSKTRANQLESEKNACIHQLEELNKRLASTHLANTKVEAEIDQMRSSWAKFEAEKNEIQDSYNDLQKTYQSTMSEFNAKLNELQNDLDGKSARIKELESEIAALHISVTEKSDSLGDLNTQFSREMKSWRDIEDNLRAELADKSSRLEELDDLAIRMQAKCEALEQNQISESSLIQDNQELQNQLLQVRTERARIELNYSNLKSQHEQVSQDFMRIKDDYQLLKDNQQEVDDKNSQLNSEVNRVKSEYDRAIRAKTSLQLELTKTQDDVNDKIRQYEILRRDFRLLETKIKDSEYQWKQLMENEAREHEKTAELNEELQVKINSIQGAANASIQEMITELDAARLSIEAEKKRAQYDSDILKTQLKATEDDIRRKDAIFNDQLTSFNLEKSQWEQCKSDLLHQTVKLQQQFDAKRLDFDKLQTEFENRCLKFGELDRKFQSLLTSKDNLHHKVNELKQSLDSQINHTRDIEEQLTADLALAKKEKRDMESLYLTMKEEYDNLKSESQSVQLQWQNDCKALKLSLDRTKQELVKTQTELSMASQRLETTQRAANETITDLTIKLQSLQHQYELTSKTIERESDRRREAEAHKMELQRLLRMQKKATTYSGTSNSTRDSFRDAKIVDVGDEKVGNSLPIPDNPEMNDHEKEAPSLQIQNECMAENKCKTENANSSQSVYQKFYNNEPMTKLELSNLPMNVIKAQLGLDLWQPSPGTSKNVHSPIKKNSRKKYPKYTNDALSTDDQCKIDKNNIIPVLDLERLSQKTSESSHNSKLEFTKDDADSCRESKMEKSCIENCPTSNNTRQGQVLLAPVANTTQKALDTRCKKSSPIKYSSQKVTSTSKMQGEQCEDNQSINSLPTSNNKLLDDISSPKLCNTKTQSSKETLKYLPRITK